MIAKTDEAAVVWRCHTASRCAASHHTLLGTVVHCCIVTAAGYSRDMGRNRMDRIANPYTRWKRRSFYCIRTASSSSLHLTPLSRYHFSSRTHGKRPRCATLLWRLLHHISMKPSRLVLELLSQSTTKYVGFLGFVECLFMASPWVLHDVTGGSRRIRLRHCARGSDRRAHPRRMVRSSPGKERSMGVM